MSSSADEHGTRTANRASIRDLRTHARQDRRFALLLEACLTDPTMSKVLLLHRTELFPRLEVPDRRLDGYDSGRRASVPEPCSQTDSPQLEDIAGKYAAHSPHPARIAEAQQRVQCVETAVSEPTQDAFALAVLHGRTLAAEPR
ncbi:MAG: hypothetical protein DMG59_10155, partial [Acidobacteria bacterium]